MINCLQCNILFNPISKHGDIRKFCSKSCAASYNNALRTKESREKQKETITQKLSVPAWTRIYYLTCEICCKSFIWKFKKKACSKTCSGKIISKKISKYIAKNPLHKFNRSPLKRSYMEQSFEEWLILHGMKNSLHGYLYEIGFFNTYNKKYGRADFVFPKHRLIIELDGSHHMDPKRTVLDQIRDDYLKSRGWNVIRISHKEYKKKVKEQLLIDLLFGASVGSQTPYN